MGVANRTPIVTNGLVVNLDAGNYRSYAKTGTIWTDISNNNNNGTLINGPTYNPENGGNIVFDGVNDYCLTSYFGNATDSFTYSGWARTSAADGLIFSRGRDGAGSGFSVAMGLGLNGLVGSTIIADGSQIVSESVTGLWKPNEWGYVTGVWQSGVSLSIYFNGVFYNRTLTSSINLRTSTEGWGLASITTGLFYNIKIANATIYNRALTASEISQNYMALKSRFGL
jgi:hypothetical protein